MEFKHEYLYKMSLKDLAARRVAILLCSHPSMLEFISGIQDLNKESHNTEMNEKSKFLAAELRLPITLEKEISSIIKPVSREIIKWIKFHEDFLEPYSVSFPRLSVLQHLCWTRLGTIDYLETAKALLCSRRLRVEQGCKLACLYCVEEEARTFVKKITIRDKKFVINDVPLIVNYRIIAIWFFTVKGGGWILYSHLIRRVNSLNQHAFEFFAFSGHRAATQYFFEKLTPQEKRESLELAARAVAKRCSVDNDSYLHEYQKFSDVLSYLMSVMLESERHRLLQTYPFQTLQCFLDWPRQGAFIEHAKYVFESCDRFTEENYSRLLLILARNISSGYDYAELYREFLLAAPKRFRDYALDRYALFVHELLKLKAVGTLNFLIAHLDDDEKRRLALKLGTIRFCPVGTVVDDK